MPPPKRTREQRKTGTHGVLFVDLRDQLAVWPTFQLIGVELEIGGLKAVIAEVRIAIEELLDVSRDERAHGHTRMTCDRRLPNRGRTGHLFDLGIKTCPSLCIRLPYAVPTRG